MVCEPHCSKCCKREQITVWGIVDGILRAVLLFAVAWVITHFVIKFW